MTKYGDPDQTTPQEQSDQGLHSFSFNLNTALKIKTVQFLV